MHRLKSAALGVAVVTASLLLATPSTARAQASIAGAWVVSVDSPQGAMTLDTTFKQEGEKVSGEVNSPMGSVDFTGTLVKNELAVNYSVSIQGQNLDIHMTGTVDGDKMSGLLDVGGMMQAPWTAKRKPAETASAPASGAAAGAPATVTTATGVAGKWNFNVMMGPNPLSLTGQFTQQGEAVSGTIATPVGDLPVTGTLVGSALTLKFTAQGPQGPLDVTMNGTLSPTGLSGTSSIAGLGESEFSATRVQ